MFNQKMQENRAALDTLEDGLDKLDMDLSDINGLVSWTQIQ